MNQSKLEAVFKSVEGQLHHSPSLRPFFEALIAESDSQAARLTALEEAMQSAAEKSQKVEVAAGEVTAGTPISVSHSAEEAVLLTPNEIYQDAGGSGQAPADSSVDESPTTPAPDAGDAVTINAAGQGQTPVDLLEAQPALEPAAPNEGAPSAPDPASESQI